MSSWNDWNNDGERDWKDAVIEHDIANMNKGSDDSNYSSGSSDVSLLLLIYIIVMIGGRNLQRQMVDLDCSNYYIGELPKEEVKDCAIKYG